MTRRAGQPADHRYLRRWQSAVSPTTHGDAQVRRGAFTLALLSAAAVAAARGRAGAASRGPTRRSGRRSPTVRPPRGPRSPPPSSPPAWPSSSAGSAGAAPSSWTPSDNRVLFSRKARRAADPRLELEALHDLDRALRASEPTGRLQTTAWSIDAVTDGISQGLYLRGGGDPTLSTAGSPSSPIACGRPAYRGSGPARLRRLVPRQPDRHPRARDHLRERRQALRSSHRQRLAERPCENLRPALPGRASQRRGLDRQQRHPRDRSRRRRPGRRLRLPDDGRHRPGHQRPLEQLPRRDAPQGPRRGVRRLGFDRRRDRGRQAASPPSRARRFTGENGSGLTRRNKASP